MRKFWLVIAVLMLFSILVWKVPFPLQAKEWDPISLPPMTDISPIEEIFTGWDTSTDASYQKFLDANHPFNDLKYRPNDLAAIESDFTANNARKFQLRKEVWTQFADLARHFRDHFKGKKKLSITSAYRSFAHQEQLLKSYCKAKNQCANAGSSEHQAGLALDLGTNGGRLDKASLERLQENAHKRGFHQSYQKGIEVDKTIVEPWHWRYVGESLATELYEKKLSFTEWFYAEGIRYKDAVLSGVVIN